MPNWFKRVTKERSQDLLPGETLRAATYYQGYGSAAGQIAYGATRGAGGALREERAGDLRASAMARAGSVHDAPEGSMAAHIPHPVGVLAVTDQRVVFFGYKQGFFTTKILDPAASFTFQQLTGWSYQRGSLVSTLHMSFADGSTVGLEIPRINKPDTFASTLGIPAAA